MGNFISRRRRYRPPVSVQGSDWPAESAEWGKAWGTTSKYSGELVQGRRSGQGVETWPDGIVYRGGWERGLKHGLGTWENPRAGEKYEGQWREGKRHGWGIFTDREKRIEGFWAHDNLNGQGSCIWPDRGDGRVQAYHGVFVESKRSGHGVFDFSSGVRYDGQWLNDLQNGRGTFVWPDGVKLEAQRSPTARRNFCCTGRPYARRR